MMRSALVFLLVILAGCSGPESPDTAMANAAKLSERGEFKKATTELRRALDAPGLSADQRKQLLYQIDVLHRIREDYSLSPGDLFNDLSDAVTNFKPTDFNRWTSSGCFDSKKIDGKVWYVNSSVANLFFRYPELWKRRADHHYDLPEQKGRLAIARAITRAAREQNTPYVLPHRFICTMSLSMGPGTVPSRALVRAWLPIPRHYPYQYDFKLISNSVATDLKLAPETSPIRSAYLEQHAAKDGSDWIQITYGYTMCGVHFDLDPAKVQPADLRDPELKEYTSQSPHVVFTDQITQLADRIAGQETNPMLVAKAFYDWVGSYIKYSYAREYSTLTNIGDYCLANHYGDCGQEAMLFITLCRSRGIPARWQTGWDLYPSFHDIHDWTEIYLAPYGWVPVDPWAGLFASQYCTSLTPDERRELHNFYFGGLDYYRMAANCDHSQKLDPPKQTVRSDDVDFQRGELESGSRNIYFDRYSYNMWVKELKSE